MKIQALNQTQKKWALTGMLLVALGFNLSAPIRSTMQNLDLASEGETREEVVKSRDGKHEYTLTITKLSKNQTLVHGPKQLEGKACETEDCLTHKILNVKFEDSIEELVAAFSKDNTPKKSAPKKIDLADTPAKDEEFDAEQAKLDNEERLQAERDERADALLARVSRTCARYEEDLKNAKCLTDNFVKILKSSENRLVRSTDRKKERLISPDKALEFFNEELRTPLSASLSKSELDGAAKAGTQNGAELLKKLQASLPREYSVIRKEAAKTAVDAVKGYAEEVRMMRQQTQTLSSQAQQLNNTAQSLQAELNRTQDPIRRQQISMNLQQTQSLSQQVRQQIQDSQQRSSAKLMEANQMVSAVGNTLSSGVALALQSNLVEQSLASQINYDYSMESQKALLNFSMPTLDTTMNSNQVPTSGNGPAIQGTLSPVRGIVIQQGNRGSITGGPNSVQNFGPTNNNNLVNPSFNNQRGNISPRF